MITAERLISKGSPFELVEQTVDGVEHRVFKHAPKTLPDLYRGASRHRDLDFLIWESRRFTFGEILERANTVAFTLCEQFGAGVGTKVALVLDNSPDWIIAFIAITSIGGSVVTVHRRSEVVEISASVSLAGCQIVICDAELAQFAMAFENSPRVLVADWSRLPLLPRQRADSHPSGTDAGLSPSIRPIVSAEDLALVAFTSGSTGTPKGVEVSHASVICGLMNMLLGGALASLNAERVRRVAVPSRPISLVVAPFSHISGYSNVLSALHLGSAIAIPGTQSIESVLAILEAEPITALVGATPELLGDILRSDRVGRASGSLRTIVIHGTAFNRILQDKLQAQFPHVIFGSGYGMTETNGSVCVASRATLDERPGTSGRPLPTVSMRVVDDHGRDASCGEVGEVCISGPMLMRGYCNAPEATRRVLRDGWLKTGDLGHLDRDGFLFVQDRKSQLVVCGGRSLSCMTVESAVLDNHLADEAAAFGVPDPDLGERMILAIARYGTETGDREEILDLLASLGYEGNACPEVLFVDSMPRTISGKIDRIQLRARMDRVHQ